MNYFWKLKLKNFMFHYKQIIDLRIEEEEGIQQSTRDWHHIAPPRSPVAGPAPSEEQFVDNMDISTFQKAAAQEADFKTN